MNRRGFSLLLGVLLLAAGRGRGLGQPAPAAVGAFNAYVAGVEARLGRDRTLAGPEIEQRVRREQVVVEPVLPDRELPGALLHHWRGTAFAPGATAAEFERMLRDFNAYPQRFAPEVLAAKVLSERGDRMEALLRVRQKHVLTVVMDSAYEVEFGRRNRGEGYSTSRSTRIYEIAGAGTAREHALSEAEEHGFLWRLNTYWTYEEREGGLLIQIESVSLSRSIPLGLGWALRPYVESVPRESLEFTLRSASKAVAK